MPISIVQEFPEVRIGTSGALVVNVWFSEATVRGIEAIGAAQKSVVDAHGPATMLSISMSVPRAPAPEVAEWLKKNQRSDDPNTRATIVCLLARGLGAVIARSFIAAISLVGGQRLTVVKSLAEAVDETVKIDGKVDRAVLVRDLEALLALPPPK